jgi:hypothetical protein
MRTWGGPAQQLQGAIRGLDKSQSGRMASGATSAAAAAGAARKLLLFRGLRLKVREGCAGANEACAHGHFT